MCQRCVSVPKFRAGRIQLGIQVPPSDSGNDFLRLAENADLSTLPKRVTQAKGRVERLWGVRQDRLTSELRLAGAADLDSANAVLRNFLADYNRRFARAPREILTAWRPTPENLDRICCFVHERVVSNDNIVQWEG